MASENGVPIDPVPVPATRRAVIRTGMKLAYAAPVVAASMHLGLKNTHAVSGDGCPECYVLLTESGQCVREPVIRGECPCGFELTDLGECVKDGCKDCFINLGGICVPDAFAPPNGPCQCGFEDVGGICVPRYPLL